MPEVVSNVIDVYPFRRAENGVEFLLLKRVASVRLGGTWQAVHGRIEAGETAWQAALRELKEETGLTPTSFRLFHVTERICPSLYKDGRHHLVYLDFLIDGWEGTLRDSEELSEGEWLLPEDAMALPLTYTTRRLVEYYAEVGDDGPVHFLPDDVPTED